MITGTHVTRASTCASCARRTLHQTGELKAEVFWEMHKAKFNRNSNTRGRSNAARVPDDRRMKGRGPNGRRNFFFPSPSETQLQQVGAIETRRRQAPPANGLTSVEGRAAALGVRRDGRAAGNAVSGAMGEGRSVEMRWEMGDGRAAVYAALGSCAGAVCLLYEQFVGVVGGRLLQYH